MFLSNRLELIILNNVRGSNCVTMTCQTPDKSAPKSIYIIVTVKLLLEFQNCNINAHSILIAKSGLKNLE